RKSPIQTTWGDATERAALVMAYPTGSPFLSIEVPASDLSKSIINTKTRDYTEEKYITYGPMPSSSDRTALSRNLRAPDNASFQQMRTDLMNFGTSCPQTKHLFQATRWAKLVARSFCSEREFRRT